MNRSSTLRVTALTLLGTLALGAAPAASRPSPQAIPSRPPGPDEEQAIEVNINRLTSIDYERGKELPEDVQDLDGKRIEIVGYMGVGTLEGVDHFELLPEPCECGRSKVQHFIDVKISDGLTVYKPGRITLVGSFSAGEQIEDGFVVSLYRLTIESLE